MKKNMIAVCDSDTDYACNFTEYLNNKKKLPFRAEAFTDVEKFYSSVGSQPPPMLLIAQKDVDERIQQIKEENVVVLSDEKEEPKSPYKCIYKYQSAESVIKEVMEYYTEKTQVPFCSDARQGMKIVGIYSPSEICANCLFALAAAQILGEDVYKRQGNGYGTGILLSVYYRFGDDCLRLLFKQERRHSKGIHADSVF